MSAGMRPCFFSKETLTLPDFYKSADDDPLAKALYSVIGTARIVIVGRHQIKMIESLYLYHAKGSPCEPVESWPQAKRKRVPAFLFQHSGRDLCECIWQGKCCALPARGAAGRSPPIMDMYGGIPPRFDISGEFQQMQPMNSPMTQLIIFSGQ